MPIKNCKHWIFDMDGTLTKAIHDFDAIRTALGISDGQPILEAIENMPAPQAAAATQELFDIEWQIAKEAVQQPGAEALLQSLTAQQCQIGILTRNGYKIAIETLKAAGLAEFFIPEQVIGRENCKPKPDPEGVQLLLNHWQADPEDSVMVGDYLFDLEAGFRAGAHTVHLDVDNSQHWPEFTSVKVASLTELTGLVV